MSGGAPAPTVTRLSPNRCLDGAEISELYQPKSSGEPSLVSLARAVKENCLRSHFVSCLSGLNRCSAPSFIVKIPIRKRIKRIHAGMPTAIALCGHGPLKA